MNEQQFIEYVTQARKAKKVIGELELTEPTAFVLLVLHEGVETSNKEIAEKFGGEDAATPISLAVKKLVNWEYITQKEDESDRRIKHSALTPAGKDAVKELIKGLKNIGKEDKKQEKQES